MIDIKSLSDKELRELKDKVLKEISKRHKEKMSPKKRKCSECEYYKILTTKEDMEKYHKHSWDNNSRGPFCFCGHPNGKLIPFGHTTPSWCKKED